MSFEIPDDLYYLETHEWVRFDDGSAEQSSAGNQSSTGGTARIGISDFAQDELGDVVFVELPGEGDTLAQEDQFGVIESIKAVSDLYSPVSGTVSAVNEELFDAPELVNEDPYEDGWMLELEDVSEDDAESLLSPDEYREQIE